MVYYFHVVALLPMTIEGPHQQVGIDIMGLLTTSKNGNRYILVMVDYFSKWCEAVPMPQQDALTVTLYLNIEIRPKIIKLICTFFSSLNSLK